MARYIASITEWRSDFELIDFDPEQWLQEQAEQTFSHLALITENTSPPKVEPTNNTTITKTMILVRLPVMYLF